MFSTRPLFFSFSGHSIDLRTSMVKEAIKSDRRFCFELISPQSKRVYQVYLFFLSYRRFLF